MKEYNRIEELEKALKEAELDKFYHEMKDGWSSDDFEISNKIEKQIGWYYVQLDNAYKMEKEVPEEWCTKYGDEIDNIKTAISLCDIILNDLVKNGITHKDYMREKLGRAHSLLSIVLDNIEYDKEENKNEGTV